jgi:basic membrane lipoprotein Med (substrate-binding protein (PBP1-ABC) superfamily)
MEGKFSGGIYEFGLDFEAVGYIDNGKKIKKEIKTHADKYVTAIMTGSIVVPKNKKDLESFIVTENIVPQWSVEEI